MTLRVFRHANGLLPNLLAIVYSLLGYCCELWFMSIGSFLIALLGTHWFAHDTVFARHEVNSWADVFSLDVKATGNAQLFTGAVVVSFLTAV